MKRSAIMLLFLILGFVFTVPVFAIPPAQSEVLKWDKNTDASGYYVGIIDRVQSPDMEFPESPPCTSVKDDTCVMLYDMPGGDNTTVVIAEILIEGIPLKKDNRYEYKVKAYNEYGNTSDWSTSVNYTIPISPIITPPNLRQETIYIPMVIIININGEKVSLEIPPINQGG